MIKVKILEAENLKLGFKISGHALSVSERRKSGDAYDLICNSVSVLSQSIVIGIVEVIGIDVKYEMTYTGTIYNVSNERWIFTYKFI